MLFWFFLLRLLLFHHIVILSGSNYSNFWGAIGVALGGKIVYYHPFSIHVFCLFLCNSFISDFFGCVRGRVGDNATVVLCGVV